LETHLRPCFTPADTDDDGVGAGMDSWGTSTFSSNSIPITFVPDGLGTTTDAEGEGEVFSLFSSSPVLPPVD